MIERRADASARARASDGVEEGYFLLALAAPEPERAALIARLRASGAPELGATAFTQYFADPDYNRFGVSSYPLDGAPSD